MFYDFIYLAKGFRMRPKGTINLKLRFTNAFLRKRFKNVVAKNS